MHEKGINFGCYGTFDTPLAFDLVGCLKSHNNINLGPFPILNAKKNVCQI